ncbi:hypothetical protein J437_LFUL009115 [Ladona fulva]|uniref:Uncharacterized protein n=1 Tax=Ladona fulva TaxID=123851 RepID=A0A8K0K7K7_LADFU|nr:hypothetical protein J437_LFUL009115 [Ladona fulva]
MEKSGGTMTRSYRYDTYHHPPPPPHQYVAHPTHHAHPHHNLHQEATKLQQYGEQTKKTVPEEKLRRRCCRGVATGLCSNLGVCALLLSYTLLGSFIFMAIEGGGETDSRRSASRRPNGTHGESPLPSSSVGSSPWLLSVSAGPRERTVESIWDITVSLNILYRENWTRLAAEEVAKFQEFLVQRLAEEWGPPPTQPAPLAARSLEAVIPTPQVYHEWNFARAFLYSLTVLTTIGEYH